MIDKHTHIYNQLSYYIDLLVQKQTAQILQWHLLGLLGSKAWSMILFLYTCKLLHCPRMDPSTRYPHCLKKIKNVRRHPYKKVYFLVVGPLRGGRGVTPEPLRKKIIFTRTSSNTRKNNKNNKLARYVLCWSISINWSSDDIFF